MLGSEVIKQIQNLIDEYGDLPIEISLNGSDQEEVLANHFIKIEKYNEHGMVK